MFDLQFFDFIPAFSFVIDVHAQEDQRQEKGCRTDV
jgi:hypothetical protein